MGEPSGIGPEVAVAAFEHFGGRIWAEDAALGGACICFTLPAAAVERAAA